MIISQMIAGFARGGGATRVMTDDPADTERYAARRIAPLVPPWPSERRFSSRVGMAAALARAWARPTDLSGSMAWADVCVSAGGGYLYDDGSLSSRINLIQRLLPMRAAFRVGVPVVLFSQSIGPFKSRPWERLVANHLRRAQVVHRARGDFGGGVRAYGSTRRRDVRRHRVCSRAAAKQGRPACRRRGSDCDERAARALTVPGRPRTPKHLATAWSMRCRVATSAWW